MSMSGKYLLDANVFIEAHKRYYAFDIAPSFWQTLNHLAEDNKVISIDRVKKELEKVNDELFAWITTNFANWFMSTNDENVFKSYAEIMKWAQDQDQYYDYAKAEFADTADSWLIAYAHAYNHTIVTHEVYKPDSKKRILIPNVCLAFNIPYTNTFDMLRDLKTKINIFI